MYERQLSYHHHFIQWWKESSLAPAAQNGFDNKLLFKTARPNLWLCSNLIHQFLFPTLLYLSFPIVCPSQMSTDKTFLEFTERKKVAKVKRQAAKRKKKKMAFAPTDHEIERDQRLVLNLSLGRKHKKGEIILLLSSGKGNPSWDWSQRSLFLPPHEVDAARACCQFRRTGMTIKYGWGWAEICPFSLALHALGLNVTYHTRWTPFLAMVGAQ